MGLTELQDPFFDKCTLAIPTAYGGYSKLRDEEYQLAERLYGSGINFLKNMEMLAQAGIPEIKIVVPNPNSVERTCAGSSIALVQGAILFPFSSFNSNFIASASGYDRSFCWRAKRKEKVEKKGSVQRRGAFWGGEESFQ